MYKKTIVTKNQNMKKLIFIFTVLISIGCKAQTIYPLGTSDFNTNSYYIKDTNNYHDDIVGTWKWENSSDSFEITIQEFEQFRFNENSSIYRDCLFGKYTYKINNQVVSEVPIIEPFPNMSISFYFETPVEYKVIIKDTVSEVVKEGLFTLTSSTTATIKFFDIKGIVVGGNGNGQEWSLPDSLTLIKQ
jgi:hypothetical protein